jgi:carbamate kinase
VKIVVALDGHLLLPQDARVGISGQKEAAVRMAGILGEMVKAGHQFAITHGNGPQIGNMLFRAEIARHAVYALPLDVCGADTQGATGYLLQQALHNWLLQQGIEQEITTIVTQVVVDEGDLEAANLTKGVGPYFDQQRTQAYEDSRSWNFVLVPGHGYQRVVPTLLPKRIVEMNSIRYLLERGVIVICTGGGGVPVRVDAQGQLVGVEAVIDKAHTAAHLAREIGAKTIVFVSPWERIERTFAGSIFNGLTCIPHSVLKELVGERMDLDESTRAKLVASQQFLETGGQSVLIVSPEQMGARPQLGWGVRLLADDVVSEQERT